MLLGRLLGLVVTALATVLVIGGCGGGAPATGTITVTQLPPEGRTTVGLIEAGGPFPYSRDGAVFGNFEGLLPSEPNGYYREYTVPTPGSPDRGARRIITGKDGAMYYTADHYGSFSRIEQGK